MLNLAAAFFSLLALKVILGVDNNVVLAIAPSSSVPAWSVGGAMTLHNHSQVNVKPTRGEPSRSRRARSCRLSEAVICLRAA